MKLVLMMVGKTVSHDLDAMVHDYVERIKHYVPFEMSIISDLKNTKNLTESDIKQKEGELILAQLSSSDYLVLLDDKGTLPTSLEFASWMQKRLCCGEKRLIMVIGGAYGFSPAVYARAQEKLSLSRLTFSHQLVRVIAAEQIYRAMTILKGEPYHHE